ncbi:MAG: TlyA family RNA methyltransferase [Atopostipes sp.]|nr:TlyA family RNA methyltransferase [Atopostipes sp.]
MKKKRADNLLVEQGFVENKKEALAHIMSGKVFTRKEIRILTPGENLAADTKLYIKGQEKKYVSRGGFKLEKALSTFGIQLEGKTVLDIGASTGGFTDVSLKNGAKKVYALDVGTNQLAWKLRSHDQVIVMEQTNFRHSLPEDFKEGRPEFATIDVSFISLELIFPALYPVLEDKGEVVALIKPQFEAEREEVGEGGIVSDPSVYRSVLEKITEMAKEESFGLQDLTISPIQGAKGNIEFLSYFVKDVFKEKDSEELIEQLLVTENLKE